MLERWSRSDRPCVHMRALSGLSVVEITGSGDRDDHNVLGSVPATNASPRPVQ